jgi:antitoxin HicB
MSRTNRHVGSTLDDFLREEGILEEAMVIAIKDAVAFQVQKAIKPGNISKMEMARRMKTSRAALDRFLAPGNASVILQILRRAARAIGRDLRIKLV